MAKRTLTCLVAVAVAGGSFVESRAIAAPGITTIGAMADVGVPDGATTSLVVRPLRPVRLHLGISYNGISPGVRGGISWVPLASWCSPTLSVEYGHYRDGDANPFLRMVSGDQTLSSPALQRIGYDYANAHVGFELGRKWVTFYLHGGMSRITGAIHRLDATASTGMSTATVTFTEDPTVTITTLSARIGLIVYFH